MSEPGRLLCRDAGPDIRAIANSPAANSSTKTKRFICDSQDLTLHAVLSDWDNTVR
jgi:hypothetical protein